MRTFLLLSLFALSCAEPAHAKRRARRANPDKHDAPGTLVLNGEPTEVRWSDGDSFRILTGPYRGRGTRLWGYNTLEAYGPVHQWGTWTARELFEIAKESSTLGASEAWDCTTDGKEDAYHRLLIKCPGAAMKMVRAGHALAYFVEGEADPELLAAMQDAKARRVGIWEKGVVDGVITSLHSIDERDDDDEAGSGGERTQAYNRVVDTLTGDAKGRPHRKTYGLCEVVCEETRATQSCMTYVPFKQRYQNKPDCLK